MLTIIQDLDKWCHFLGGTPYKFDIFTDHKNLSYFKEAQKLNHQQARWSIYLSQFKFPSFIVLADSWENLIPYLEE